MGRGGGDEVVESNELNLTHLTSMNEPLKKLNLPISWVHMS